MELEFTEEAGKDLQYIRDFLVEAGVLNCEQIVTDILSSADKLRSFPRLGVKVGRADAPDLIRDYFCRGFCLRYLIT